MHETNNECLFVNIAENLGHGEKEHWNVMICVTYACLRYTVHVCCQIKSSMVQ